MKENYKIQYYDKDGTGFMGGDEPWLEGDFDSRCEAEQRATDLINSGYKNVKVTPRFCDQCPHYVPKTV